MGQVQLGGVQQACLSEPWLVLSTQPLISLARGIILISQLIFSLFVRSADLFGSGEERCLPSSKVIQ